MKEKERVYMAGEKKEADDLKLWSEVMLF